MPYVLIQVTPEEVTNEKKQALISGATQLLVDVLNKDPQTTFIIIEEIDMDNWGIGGRQVSVIRKNSPKK